MLRPSSGDECWRVEADHLDLSPSRRPQGTLLRIDSDDMPIVEEPTQRGA